MSFEPTRLSSLAMKDTENADLGWCLFNSIIDNEGSYHHRVNGRTTLPALAYLTEASRHEGKRINGIEDSFGHAQRIVWRVLTDVSSDGLEIGEGIGSQNDAMRGRHIGSLPEKL